MKKLKSQDEQKASSIKQGENLSLAAPSPLNIAELEELMQAMVSHGMGSLTVKKGDFELTLETESKTLSSSLNQTTYNPGQASHLLPQDPFQENSSTVASPHERKTSSLSSNKNIKFVESPMVGTYYSSPAPQEASFIKVGDKVKPDTVVFIIEAMKVMNEVKAGVEGTVKELLLEDSQPVEFGSRVLAIET